MNQIFDPYRRKYVAATPEETVRQWFCSFLTKEKNFPIVSIANECTININGLSQRCDTIVYKQGNPVMLVEYKAPSVKISQDVINQALRYNSKLHVPYIVLCNGNQIFCIKIDYSNLSSIFLSDIPSFEEL